MLQNLIINHCKIELSSASIYRYFMLFVFAKE